MKKEIKYIVIIAILLFICGYIEFLRYSAVKSYADEIDFLNVSIQEYQVKNDILETEVANLTEQTEVLTGKLADTEESLGYQENLFDELYPSANLQVIRENHEIKEDIFEGSDGVSFPYAFYKPNGLDSYEEKPLILYLHGSGECGYDIGVLERCKTGFSGYVYEGKICPNAYILMPQCVGDWNGYENSIIELIEELCKEYNIDKSRISITGHSLGAWGTIQFVYDYPDYFSCCAPMSAIIDINKCVEIQIPILFLVGEFDNSQSFIDANEKINENGGNSELIVYEREGHLIPYHYLDDNCAIINWLISK